MSIMRGELVLELGSHSVPRVWNTSRIVPIQPLANRKIHVPRYERRVSLFGWNGRVVPTRFAMSCLQTHMSWCDASNLGDIQAIRCRCHS